MSFLRQTLLLLLLVVVFAVALIAVSARIFLPNDLVAPAPLEPTDAARLPAIHQPWYSSASIPLPNARSPHLG